MVRYSYAIKKYSKNNKRKNKDGGYTLVELLAIIVILSLIISIVVVVAINIVNKSKEKSYRVTVNNIEKVASSYAIENHAQYEWMDAVDDINNEYFCVTVQDLIDKGYLKNDVLNSNIDENTKVNKDLYIYLERNKLSKSITRNLLLSFYGNEFNNYCNDYKTGKDIEFIEQPTGWAKEKKVIINYKIFNLENNDNISNYKYKYEFLVENKKIDWTNFNNYLETSSIENITSNGVIKAYIMDGSTTIHREYTINSIDKSAPEIELSIDGNNIDASKKIGMEYAKSRNVTIKLVDDQSGLKKGSYTIKYDWSTSSKTCDQLTNDVVINVNDNNSSGSVTISNKTGKGKLYVCGEGVTDNVGNVRGKEVENIDLYLDNVKPVISLGNYNGNSTVSKTVTIPILVTDNDSGVDRSSFITSDIVVLIGGDELINGFELSSIDSNNYNLVINNTTLSGNVILKINDGNVLDNAKNGNEDTSLNTNIIFNNTYLIKYDANGGSGAPGNQTKTYGKDLTLSSTKPTRSGYTFLGWSESKTATSAMYSAGGKYTKNEDKTLYAVWNTNTYTVSYNANGGSGAPGSQTKTYGVDLTLSSTKPTRSGYTFLGWSESSSATSATYNVGGTYKKDSSVTLYAVWKINTFTISYNANGGSGAPGGQTKTYGKDLTLSSTKPTRSGYTFLGWSESSSATSATYNAGGTYKKDSSVTLYAIWKINTYTVSYNANGGSGVPSSQTKTYGVDLTLSSTKPTRSGYTFLGWSKLSNATSATYSAGGKYTSNENITLYAIWKINTYTVSYNANGGSGAPVSQTKTYGVDLTLSSTKPTRSGYTFLGWSESSSATSATYSAGGTYTGNKKLDLYAVWRNNIFNVSFNANGGELSSFFTAPIENVYVVPITGSYKLEVWGSQGAGAAALAESDFGAKFGGYGGYSVGNISLTAGQKLYVNVGSGSTVNEGTSVGSKIIASYNGGGVAWSYNDKYVSAGGGATHIATVSGTLPTLSSYASACNSSSSSCPILIVAGGGGGFGYHISSSTFNKGGSGGGYKGGSFSYSGTTYSTGGSQSAAGNGKYESSTFFNGSFGQGGNVTWVDGLNGGAGGGGGFYGGGGSPSMAGGGGGSGYIGHPSLTNKAMYCYNCSTSTGTNTKTISTSNYSVKATSNYAKLGTGAAKITLLTTSIKVENGLTYGTLPIPYREGYTFKEWNTKADGSGTTITSNTIVNLSSNQTIYAIWNKGEADYEVLYFKGYENVNVTGGWNTKYSYGTGTFSKNYTESGIAGMNISTNCSSCIRMVCTANKINISDYRLLSVWSSGTNISSTSGNRYFGLSSNGINFAVSKSLGTGNEVGSYLLNISDYTGSYYVCVNISGVSSNILMPGIFLFGQSSNSTLY